MNILALDLATKTGWAFWHKTSGCESGTADFKPLKDDKGSRYTKYRKWLKWAIRPSDEADMPDVIYCEDVHLRGKGSVVLCGFLCHTQEIASTFGIPVKCVHSKTIKKWATGNGNATKTDMVKEAQRRGYFPKNDDEADALMLMEYAKEQEASKP